MGKRFFGRTRPAWPAAVLVFLLASGCNEPVTTYQVPGTCIADGQKVLVLPFADTRTFVDSGDPHKDDLSSHAREVFVTAMRKKNVDGSKVLTPDLAEAEASLTNAQLAEMGRAHGADVVVAGQVFSFTGTRAASIPPRAGMFIRVVSAKDGSLLFVGDHYQAAAVPGAPGGRDLQARQVAERLVDGMALQAELRALAVRGVSSGVAYASLAARGRVRTAGNKGGIDGLKIDGEHLPEPPPLLGFSAPQALDPDQWEEQIVPEVPPIIDFDAALPTVTENSATAETPETNVATIETEAAPEQAAVPARPVPVAESIDTTEDYGIADYDEDSWAEPAELGLFAAKPEESEKPAEAVETASASTAGETVDEPAGALDEPALPPVVAEMPLPLPPPEMPDGAEYAEAATAPETDGGAMPEVAATDATDARRDDVPEAPNASEEDDVAAAPYGKPLDAMAAARMTGDELAADLFATNGLLDDEPTAPAARPEETAVAAVPADDSDVPETAVAENAPEVAAVYAEYAEAYGTSVSALVIPEAGAAETEAVIAAADIGEAEMTAAPVQAIADAFDAPLDTEAALPAWLLNDGPIYSVPLAVEQPRAFMSVDLDRLPEIPARSESAGLAVAASDENLVKVLVLPYHDRQNPNNLIEHTGGGEVVTTLYGAQLAMDPEVRVLWDGSGQATHGRLVDRWEAVEMGRIAGADFVVRGQVVEFRRAQSVPSFYSVVISTAVLAAQIFFAEMSGVDVATEVYRVSDGACVMSRRDRAQQKYVVQAEKTVRRLAAGMAEGVLTAMKNPEAETMDPMIDELVPLTFLTNPR